MKIYKKALINVKEKLVVQPLINISDTLDLSGSSSGAVAGASYASRMSVVARLQYSFTPIVTFPNTVSPS